MLRSVSKVSPAAIILAQQGAAGMAAKAWHTENVVSDGGARIAQLHKIFRRVTLEGRLFGSDLQGFVVHGNVAATSTDSEGELENPSTVAPPRSGG